MAELLRVVERGETVAITRHGKTIAHLVPAIEQETVERRRAVETFLEMRSKWRPTVISKEEILVAPHEGHGY